MPNHTTNILTVDGPDDQFEAMYSYVQGTESDGTLMLFSLGSIIPMPNGLVGTVSGSEKCKPDWQKERSYELKAKYGCDNWYDWSVTHWGTKWDVYFICADKWNLEERTISFQSAWSPPTQVIAVLSEKFPALTFKLQYADEGCDYVGVARFTNGEISDECYIDSDTAAFKALYEQITGRDLDAEAEEAEEAEEDEKRRSEEKRNDQ